MKENHISILNKLTKKPCCIECGALLERERVMRVVTRDDKDFGSVRAKKWFRENKYEYDKTVYINRFRCPECHRRRSLTDQLVLSAIQRKLKTKMLTKRQIKENYESAYEARNKRRLVRLMLLILLRTAGWFALTGLLIVFDDAEFNTMNLILWGLFAFFIIFGRQIYTGIRILRKKQYSHRQEFIFKKLHAYAYGNATLLKESGSCRCFHCLERFNSNEITDYTEEGTTAVCPRCEEIAVIPDNIDFKVDDETLREMSRYWF